jgi:predicted alpha/beta hydrolase
VDEESSRGEVTCRDGGVVEFAEHGSAHRRDDAASVLFLPALGVPIGYYDGMLGAWAAGGRHIVAVERRRMPRLSRREVRASRYGYATIIREDLPAVVASGVFGGAGGIVLAGHSLGGQLALLAAASGAIDVAAVVAIASGTSSPAAQDTRVGRLQRRGQVLLVDALSALLGYWPGDRLGFGGRQPRSLMRDWCHEGRRGAYRLHGDAADHEAALARMSLPLLVVSLAGDRTIPQAAVEHLLGRLPADAEHRRIEPAAAAAFDHIRWARREHGRVVGAVEEWIATVL